MEGPPLPLDSPLWTRLYGPYGVQDVVGELQALSHTWDMKRVEYLFWEMLHHQEDLYPATYAALPWIWQIAPKTGEPGDKVLLFLSWVLYCALRHAEGVETARDLNLVGLSLNVEDHQHAWLKPGERLRAQDMETLAELKVWFLVAMSEVSAACLDAAGRSDSVSAAYLLLGVLAERRARPLALAVTMFADGEKDAEIEAIVSASSDPVGVAADIAAVLGPNASDLKDFLRRRSRR